MSESAPDLGAMVSKLLGDPELVSRIASTVGIEGQRESEKKEGSDAADATPTGASTAGIDGLFPMLSVLGGAGKTSSYGSVGASRRCALLSALKPFCNEHRCKTIDYMIGISKLSETLIPGKRG